VYSPHAVTQGLTQTAVYFINLHAALTSFVPIRVLMWPAIYSTHKILEITEIKWSAQLQQETHQQMRQWMWTFFMTTSHMYYKALRPSPPLLTSF